MSTLKWNTLSISWKAFWNGKTMVRRLLLQEMVCCLCWLVGIENENTERDKKVGQDSATFVRND